ncbi:response regulator [Kineosporia sp. J2-2]|uniref:histidine kinase n=1 Tax=Kineosporia corallincola TaxID=2835133 RepID=A0ABS5TS56_9ACTN|nr:response regulator [Kineosporia corallincola]MBT0773616.1 response regulator [Kineosporia corallincola]
MNDLEQYFRIEARELIDELSVALSELSAGGPAGGPAGVALRHAHTLKGAARVVGRVAMADQVHELEELLGPYRNSAEPVQSALLGRMQVLVDSLSDDLEGHSGEPAAAEEESPGPAIPEPVIPGPRAESPSPSGRPADAGVPVASPTEELQASPGNAPEARDHPSTTTIETTRTEELANTAQTARASLTEIDNVIDGVGQTRIELGAVRDAARRVWQLRAEAGPGGPGPGGNRLTEKQSDELAALARILGSSADRMERELREVYTTAERLRLIPVTTIVPDLERGVRDVTAAQGKLARLEVRGAEIALDANVLAGAQTALRQIVRNAVAHGVETPAERLSRGKSETGLVRVEVTHGAAGVRFRCTDDGRGIDIGAVRTKMMQSGRTPDNSLGDADILKLLLGSGISTASTVSEISGHGIGLDVVQDVVRRIGGRIEIHTEPGRGTTIDLTAPASMTAQEVVLVRPQTEQQEFDDPDPAGSDDAGPLVALPLHAIRQARRVTRQDFSGAMAVMHDGRRIPYAPLPDVLGLPSTERDGPAGSGGRTVLVLDGANGPVAVGVGRLVGTAEVAVRTVPALAPVPPLVCGVWIDIDGRPRPVLDPVHLAAEATARRMPRSPVADLVPVPVARNGISRRATILIVDDSLTTRMLERSILESAGYRVEQAGSAEEGLAMAARKRYAVAVVDVEMPGMDGFGFIEQTRTRAELRHMPCILVTSKASPQDRERGRAAGARAHIDKGEFHQSTLLDRVAELVAEGER